MIVDGLEIALQFPSSINPAPKARNSLPQDVSPG